MFDWKRVFTAALCCAGKKDTREQLNAVCIQREGEQLRIMATDGHIGLVITTGFPDVVQMFATGEAIITRASLEKALKLGGGELRFDAGRLLFGELPLALMEGWKFAQLYPIVAKALEAKRTPIVPNYGVDVILMERVSKAAGILLKGREHSVVEMRCGKAASIDSPILFLGEGLLFSFTAVLMPARI